MSAIWSGVLLLPMNSLDSLSVKVFFFQARVIIRSSLKSNCLFAALGRFRYRRASILFLGQLDEPTTLLAIVDRRVILSTHRDHIY